jgi:putative membrane protein (TIGR04086 family)
MQLPTPNSSTLHWSRILLAGAVVASLTMAFVYLAIYAYVIFYPLFGQEGMSSEQLRPVVTFVGGWGARFFLIATVLAALWVGRKVEERARVHGLLVGLIAVAIVQTIVFFVYPPVTPEELSIYIALGLTGGGLGALWDAPAWPVKSMERAGKSAAR